MKKNVVIVYGSGASYASGYKTEIIEKQKGNYFHEPILPPTDQGFFKDIRDDFLEEEYPALWMFKHFLFSSDSDVGLEEIWTALDLNHKHIKLGTYTWEKETKTYFDLIKKGEIEDKYQYSDWELHNRKFKLTGDCGRDFRRLIYNVYSNFIEPHEKENHFKRLHKKISDAEKCNLLGYITFNYDCYLESALKINSPYITENNEIQEVSKDYNPIIKLHGSLNWKEKSTFNNIIFQNPAYERNKQVEPNFSSNLNYIQSAIISPTIFKQEINDDLRDIKGLTRIILHQWTSAINLLQDTDKIICVGYSFPISDFHSKRIFQITCMNRRKRNDKQPIKILNCIKPKNDEKKNLLKKIFGEDPITVEGFTELLESEELNDFLENS